MKKIALLCAVAALSILLLCGCSKKDQTKSGSDSANLQSFSAIADITYNGLSLTAEIAKSAPNNITLKINSPEQLNGMQFSFDGKDTKVSYYGISFNIPKNTATAKALASAVFSVINNISEQSGADVSEEDGRIIINGKTDQGRYTFTLDKKTGTPVSLSMPDLNLECAFSDFK